MVGVGWGSEREERGEHRKREEKVREINRNENEGILKEGSLNTPSMRPELPTCGLMVVNRLSYFDQSHACTHTIYAFLPHSKSFDQSNP